MGMRPSRAMLLVIGSVTACHSGRAASSRAAVRDSSGIRIVESTRPPSRDSVAFVVDSAPMLALGGRGDGHSEFGRVAGLARMRDGVVIVADGNAGELRFFDSAGTWWRTVGRKGQGPGEFDWIGALYRLGPDSVAVYDTNHRRVSVFGVEGRLLREMALPQNPEAGFPSVVGVLGRDLLVRTYEFSQSQQTGRRRETVPILRYPHWSMPAESLGRFPGTELYVIVERNSSGLVQATMSSELPFGRILTLRASAGRFYVGTSDRYEVSDFDSVGAPVRIVRWSHPPVPVNAADLAAMKRQRLEGFRPGAEAARDRIKAALDEMTVPSTKPAYEDFQVGDDGRLWVRQYDQPAQNLRVRYDVFDPDGQWLGHVTFPPRFFLYQAGTDFALGVWRDADDVEQVRLYGFHRTR